jgi:hypothetical protein
MSLWKVLMEAVSVEVEFEDISNCATPKMNSAWRGGAVFIPAAVCTPSTSQLHIHLEQTSMELQAGVARTECTLAASVIVSAG